MSPYSIQIIVNNFFSREVSLLTKYLFEFNKIMHAGMKCTNV